MSKLFTTIFAVIALLVTSVGARANIDPATQLYVDTVAAMKALPEPPFVTYRLVTQADTGLQASLNVYAHDVWLHFEQGKNVATWSVAHRASDFRSLIVSGDGNSYVTNRAFFDPTWYSAYHAMRTGMFFDVPTHSQPDQPTVPTPAPAFTPDATLKTIATEQVAVATLYTARDRGAGKCPNGDAGHVLQFTPHGPAIRYQLVGAVVDVPAHLFCTLIFTLPSLEGAPLTDIQSYGERDGYWVRTGGEFVRTTADAILGHYGARSLPLNASENDNNVSQTTPTVRSTLTLRYALTEMDFPESIPEDFFVTPSGQ